MHVCMNCFEIYDEGRLTKLDEYGERYCPKVNCHGQVVHLDELIAPTVIELNKKGYYTKYCCSGHWYDKCCGTYIYFHEKYVPDVIPDGFVLEDDCCTIRSRFDDSEYEDKYNFVIDTNRKLYEWAKSLDCAYWVGKE